MTRSAQKQEECCLAHDLARALKEEWTISPRQESDGGPDLIVRDSTGSVFGLEVHELFCGKSSQPGGSTEKRQQSETQKTISRIQQAYEYQEPDIRLRVEFIGDLEGPQQFDDDVVQALKSLKLRDKLLPHKEDVELRYGDRHLRLIVTLLPTDWPRDQRIRPDWFSVNDSIGWLESGLQKIQCAIRAKSTRLQEYRSNLTRELKVSEAAKVEVRLLLFANHLWEYGMIRIETESTFDLCGFDSVFFFPFPGNPVELKEGMASPLRVGIL